MRGNGLQATSYVAVAELEPQIADIMLGVLREAQVAAYAEPCEPPSGASFEPRIRPNLCDRLYVDQRAEEQARDVLDDYLPRLQDEPAEEAEPAADGVLEDDLKALDLDDPDGREPSDDPEDAETTWNEIVAGYYDAAADSAAPPWPALEDVDPDPARPTDTAGTKDATSERTTQDGNATKDESATQDENAAHEGSAAPERKATPEPEATAGRPRPAPADRFRPPPPPPLPRLDPVTRLAWIALLGGPALLVVATIARLDMPAWIAVLAVLGFIGGFIVLVFRMKGGPPDNDDGAVV